MFIVILVSYRVIFGLMFVDRVVVLNIVIIKVVVIIVMFLIFYDVFYLFDVSIVFFMVNVVGGFIIVKYLEVRV